MRLVQNMLREHEIRDTIEGGGGANVPSAIDGAKEHPHLGSFHEDHHHHQVG